MISGTLVCRGCGYSPAEDDAYPFACPHGGDGGDHVIRRLLDPGVVSFPLSGPGGQPFAGYRRLLHSHRLAVAHGLGDGRYAGMIGRLDEAVAAVDGGGLSETPLTEESALGTRLGLRAPLYVKDETRGVAGSHKARHLFGVLAHLEVVEALGWADAEDRRPLAIASCGNAALAAGVVAAAGRRHLDVYVPTDADNSIVERLRSLGAAVTPCPRTPGSAGDPTYHALLAAIGGGALPFTCQGNLNGLAIEGGETLGYEIVSALARRQARVDHVVVQVGGGALATAVASAFEEAAALGAIERPPRLHTVQTESAWPLKRAYDRVVESAGPAVLSDPGAAKAALRVAAAERSSYMWPWESEPHSIAHGILDDETYDWLAVVEAMLLTGGRPVVVGEPELAEANALARELTGIPVDPTGSAGLAGLMRLLSEGAIAPGEPVAVLFTGVQR